MQQVAVVETALKVGLALWMGRKAHRKFGGIIGPDQMKWRQHVLRALQYARDGAGLMVGMDFRVFHAGAGMDDADFVLKPFSPLDGGQLLDIHLHPMPTDGDRPPRSAGTAMRGPDQLGLPQNAPNGLPVRRRKPRPEGILEPAYAPGRMGLPQAQDRLFVPRRAFGSAVMGRRTPVSRFGAMRPLLDRFRGHMIFRREFLQARAGQEFLPDRAPLEDS